MGIQILEPLTPASAVCRCSLEQIQQGLVMSDLNKGPRFHVDCKGFIPPETLSEIEATEKTEETVKRGLA